MSQQQSSVSKQYSEAKHKAHSASTTVADSECVAGCLSLGQAPANSPHSPNATVVRSSTLPGQKEQSSTRAARFLTPPPMFSAPVEGDTPWQDRAKPRHGHPSLTAIRKRLASLMMPDILEGPLADWMQAYMLNCIDEKKLDHIISALKKEGPFILEVVRSDELIVCQGMPIFMAVELLSGETIYEEGQSIDLRDIGQLRASVPSPLAICHNFQHDLESMFWILAWLVSTHIQGQDFAVMSNELFHSKNPRFHIAREHFLNNGRSCAGRLASLKQNLPPYICGGLLILRDILYNHYLARRDSIDDVSTHSPIYSLFCDTLQAVADSIPRGTVRLQRPPPPKVAERSGYFPRTCSLEEKADAPKDKVLSPHKVESLKCTQGASDADNVGDQSRAEKCPVHE
ncbi:hypothetical protein BV20DRAFT_981293 [Pilatotrama ljubarskyi]|nr:hypothetical protein BV20DRAFT_981293 [Pilatotrama ljubarskyi]